MTISRLRMLWRVAVLGLGALLTAVACLQQSIGSDGLNYLTIGAAYWRGDWEVAINGIWSPLYGVLAAGVLALADPPLEWVFPTVQIVNFAIFALSLVCFERLWAELRAAYADPQDAEAYELLPEWSWWSIGYALFAWAALDLIEIWAVTPDMLVACAVYLGASLIVRIARGRGTLGTHVALGATLGVGFLAKAPLFPLGLVALALAALAHRHLRDGLRRTLPAAVAFAVVAGPFLAVLSARAGRPTFSEVSRFTYLKHVNRIPYPHWRDGVVTGLGTPAHPPRQVHAEPDVFAYAGPVGGAYPPSFDPDYWTTGLRPRVDPFQQLNEVANSLTFYYELFFRERGPFLGIVTLVLILAWTQGGRAAFGRARWELVAWALACFAMYSLVFVTERYVAPFVVLGWGGALTAWRLRASDFARRLSATAGALLVLFALSNVIALNLAGATGLVGFRPPVEAVRPGQFQDGASASPPAVARALREAGVEPGTDVAHIGYSYTASWAYLAEARIVAEIWPEQASHFWGADESERETVLDRFREAGARYAVAEIGPLEPGAAAGWALLGGTGYLLRPLE